MANTYSSIYIHLVFAVKYRDAKIIPLYRARIHQYMTRTVNALGHKAIIVGGTDNHVHILLRYNFNLSIPDLVRDLKIATTKFINQELLLSHKFEWQRGYGVFSHSYRELDDIINYIHRQPEHHKNMTLEQEIRTMLDRCGVEYNPRYLFEDC